MFECLSKRKSVVRIAGYWIYEYMGGSKIWKLLVYRLLILDFFFYSFCYYSMCFILYRSTVDIWLRREKNRAQNPVALHEHWLWVFFLNISIIWSCVKWRTTGQINDRNLNKFLLQFFKFSIQKCLNDGDSHSRSRIILSLVCVFFLCFVFVLLVYWIAFAKDHRRRDFWAQKEGQTNIFS